MSQSKPKIKRPWGGYTILKKTRSYWVKKLFINKKARFSLQTHQHRDEIWFILSGTALITIGKKQFKAKPGEVFFIPKNKKHRIGGVSATCVLEIALGKTQEKDITRFADDYGRA